ncbi:hypothetical protein BGZ83_009195 [Gryganskiella cystojenkinii]|nr:hypothetical protein BGZ83_009195 [Gryganskiella cystojenkinii]
MDTQTQSNALTAKTTIRSLKRPSDSNTPSIKQKQKKTVQEEPDEEFIIHDEVFEEVSTPVLHVDETKEDKPKENEDDDEVDDEDWEEVAVPAAPQEQDQESYTNFEEGDEEEISGPWQYNAVEIVFDRPMPELKKTPNRGITKEDRIIRVLIHQTHLLCLIANGLCRNSWISHPNLASVALSLVPSHIAEPLQTLQRDPTREVNALQVLARWWMDSFVVTGPAIQLQEYVDIEAVGVENVMPESNGECLKKRKNLQRRLLNRSGSSDVCAQLFTAICRSLGLKSRLIESLQACPFKVTLPKDESAVQVENEAGTSASAVKKGKRKKKEVVELDESDTTRGSRVVIPTPHRTGKTPIKLPPSHKQAEGYMTDVTRRYTSQWGSATKKLRVQPSGQERFDWWAQTLRGLANPNPTREEDIEEAELLQAEISERMPTKLGDFNNHPLYALERHLKKFEVLHPRMSVLGHIRGEAIYPRSCVKQVRSKENWLKWARQLKSDDLIPVKWVKSRPATIYQMRLQQQATLSGSRSGAGKGSSQSLDNDEDMQDNQSEAGSEDGSSGGADHIPLFGEWQTEAYQPPWVVDGKVPRNQFGRQDVFTPAMVPIGGRHLKGRNIARIARQLGVDYVEAVTGFDFQSRRSVPVIQGIIVPTECAELVMDAYHEVSHHADQEANKKKKTEILKRWRKLIKGAMVRARLMEEYGDGVEEDDKDSWVPEDNDEDDDDMGKVDKSPHDKGNDPGIGGADKAAQEPGQEGEVDSGGGFIVD